LTARIAAFVLSLSLLSATSLTGRTQQPPQEKEEPAPVRVIFDTDIGDDVDDAYALTLLCSLNNARVLGVTTAFGQTRERAELALKLVRVLGRRGIPV
jgi:hypothetical protein